METRLFDNLRRSNFLKSWLIFYRFGLNVRTLLLMTLGSRAQLLAIFWIDNIIKSFASSHQITSYLSKKLPVKYARPKRFGQSVLCKKNLSRVLTPQMAEASEFEQLNWYRLKLCRWR